MVFEDNDRDVGDHKVILHDKRWGVYMKEKNALIRNGYFVAV